MIEEFSTPPRVGYIANPMPKERYILRQFGMIEEFGTPPRVARRRVVYELIQCQMNGKSYGKSV